jgi:hypothetical protein
MIYFYIITISICIVWIFLLLKINRMKNGIKNNNEDDEFNEWINRHNELSEYMKKKKLKKIKP